MPRSFSSNEASSEGLGGSWMRRQPGDRSLSRIKCFQKQGSLILQPHCLCFLANNPNLDMVGGNGPPCPRSAELMAARLQERVAKCLDPICGMTGLSSCPWLRVQVPQHTCGIWPEPRQHLSAHTLAEESALLGIAEPRTPVHSHRI